MMEPVLAIVFVSHIRFLGRSVSNQSMYDTDVHTINSIHGAGRIRAFPTHFSEGSVTRRQMPAFISCDCGVDLVDIAGVGGRLQLVYPEIPIMMYSETPG